MKIIEYLLRYLHMIMIGFVVFTTTLASFLCPSLFVFLFLFMTQRKQELMWDCVMLEKLFKKLWNPMKLSLMEKHTLWNLSETWMDIP